ncbi:MAG: 3'(2'),5'-bisphosphate nucleotidase CysQ [Flavobacteriales bacterium]|jgi:3'(2'), 5'-bisphosphate nucleotidase|nr:3'(2'),5'-bisphosphate nucleotidase CysQ [Flavobacteriales bacterium]
MVKQAWVDIAIEAAVKAGEEVLKIFHSDYEVYTKKDESPVTTADLVSNQTIQTYLQKTGVPILSEEEDFGSYESRKDLSLLWVVDPLDGTKEFINKEEDFAINIALVTQQLPVFGLIYIPVKKEVYYAIKGKGAFLLTGAQTVSLPLQTERSNYIFVKSRSHPDAKLDAYLKQLRSKHPNLEVKIVGSSVKFCEIAKGHADEYTRFNPTMEWDTAAGQVLMNEIGKQFIDLSTGKEMVYNRKNLKNNGFTVK